MPFQFHSSEIPEVVIVEPKVFEDERGFFMETYQLSEFRDAGIPDVFVQDNHSYSHKGVLRGLHYQLFPYDQGKLVRVVEGSVWDVAVDVRSGSPTFARWVGIELSSKNRRMLFIPRGFAHGFVTLSEVAHLTYKCSADYNKESEAGVRWDDSTIDIDWPIRNVLLSPRDANLPVLGEARLFDGWDKQ
ncbi:MAG TPA: dTDP-4-dehydrorhamnose 3,5-epimerase [bacterium]|nr:dTDP-4-dehydrorhamnose 3,5-epimerase [bacterium]